MTYFDLAFELARQHPKEHVLNYAVARLSLRKETREAINGANGEDYSEPIEFAKKEDTSEPIDRANWPLLQDFLFQCLMVETGTFLKILRLLIQYHQLGFDIDVAAVGEVLNSQIINQCTANYSSEAAWAVWAAIFFGIRIDKEAAASLSTMRDSIVALLTLDANRRRLIPSALDTTHWETYMDEANLYDSMWLLAYEANVKNWLPSCANRDHVLMDSNFGFLKEEGVEFYNSDQVPLAVPAGSKVDEHIFASLFRDLYY
jgi:hypothetical protein